MAHSDYIELRSGKYLWKNIESYTLKKIEELIKEALIYIKILAKQIRNAEFETQVQQKNINDEWFKKINSKQKIITNAYERLHKLKDDRIKKNNLYYHFYQIAKNYLPKQMFEDIKYLVREDIRKLELAVEISDDSDKIKK